MELNESLQKSHLIHEALKTDLSSVLNEEYPFELVEQLTEKTSRNRVFPASITLLTLIKANLSGDKSLKNALFIYNKSHEEIKTNIEQIEEENKKKVREKRRGRPSSHELKIQKSKKQSISTSTSAFAQARNRIEERIIREVYNESVKVNSPTQHLKFHGREVYITDGTYLQMQDTKEIVKKYEKKESNGYPRGLLSAIVHQGSGKIADFVLDSDSKSELELLSSLIENIPSGSLLLADDLYNCNAIFIQLIKKSIDIIVPGKRKRNYKVINTIAPNDEIVELSAEKKKSKIMQKLNIEDQAILLRRIEFEDVNVEGRKLVLFTTILDKNIPKDLIILKYFTRWDIEITIREIKTIMNINIVRAKTPEMAVKEVMVALIAYNYIREIMSKSATTADSPPFENIIGYFYEDTTNLLTDKLGRVYSHWSPGRKRNDSKNETEYK